LRLEGVKEVCAQPDAASWTCRVVRTDGHLPDVAALERAIKSGGDQYSLRGVEVVAVGALVDGKDGPSLAIDGAAETVALVPLAHKVQWSFRDQRAHPMTDEERAAYARVRAALVKRGQRARIVGPLVDGRIEVRLFTPLPEPPTRAGDSETHR
jgi:hypothetical protein